MVDNDRQYNSTANQAQLSSTITSGWKHIVDNEQSHAMRRVHVSGIQYYGAQSRPAHLDITPPPILPLCGNIPRVCSMQPMWYVCMRVGAAIYFWPENKKRRKKVFWQVSDVIIMCIIHKKESQFDGRVAGQSFRRGSFTPVSLFTSYASHINQSPRSLLDHRHNGRPIPNKQPSYRIMSYSSYSSI